jgi:hypothetical protein
MDRLGRMNRRTIAILAVVAILVTACIHASEPSLDEMAGDTDALVTSVLPVLDDLGVRNWRDQDWCKNMAYAGGQFTTNAAASNCDYFDGPAGAFTDGAESDFARLRSAIRDAHVPVLVISRSEVIGGQGQITFDVAAGMFDRFSYVYQPGYDPGALPECDCVTTAIDQDWYFVNDDWN